MLKISGDLNPIGELLIFFMLTPFSFFAHFIKKTQISAAKHPLTALICRYDHCFRCAANRTVACNHVVMLIVPYFAFAVNPQSERNAS